MSGAHIAPETDRLAELAAVHRDSDGSGTVGSSIDFSFSLAQHLGDTELAMVSAANFVAFAVQVSNAMRTQATERWLRRCATYRAKTRDRF